MMSAQEHSVANPAVYNFAVAASTQRRTEMTDFCNRNGSTTSYRKMDCFYRLLHDNERMYQKEMQAGGQKHNAGRHEQQKNAQKH